MDEILKSTWMQIQLLTEEFDFFSVTSFGQDTSGRTVPLLSLGEGPKTFFYVGKSCGSASDVLLRFARDFCVLKKSRGQVCKIPLDYFHKSYTIYILPYFNEKGEGGHWKQKISNFVRFNQPLSGILLFQDTDCWGKAVYHPLTKKLSALTEGPANLLRYRQNSVTPAFDILVSGNGASKDHAFSEYIKLRELLFFFPSFVSHAKKL